MTLDDLRVLVQREVLRLAKLSTTRAIGQEFSSRGIVGIPGKEDACPVSRGLCDTLMLGNAALLTSSRRDGWGIYHARSGEWLCSLAGGLGVVGDFASQFDCHLFPELEQPAA